MGRGARSSRLEGLLLRVVHVVLVVGAVQVLSVPAPSAALAEPVTDAKRIRRGYARGEVMHGHDAAGARLCGEVRKLGEPGRLGVKADKAETNVSLRGVQRVGSRGADGHAETLHLVSA